MPARHSELGPSKAHCYRRCPGSVKAQRGLPDTAGEEANQGTAFHEFAALCLETGANPMTMVGALTEVKGAGVYPMTLEMAEKMQPGLEVMWALADAPGAELFVETELDLSPYLGEGEIGTSDACIVDVEGRRIVGFDWKWGKGVPVHPERNDQMTLYLLGLWHIHGHRFDGIPPEEIEVIMIIEQPRADGGGGVWSTTAEWLLLEGEKVKREAAATRDPDAPRIPGTVQCKFCKAAYFGTCKEYAEFNGGLIGLKFDSLEEDYVVALPPDLIDRRTLTPVQRSQILLHKAMIQKWLDRLHEEAMADAERGADVPGLKLVDGRRTRAWLDEKKAEIVLRKRLGEDAYKKEVRSPAQIEEAMGKKLFQATFGSFVTYSEPTPILVPASDKRPARATHGELYDSLHDEDESII